MMKRFIIISLLFLSAMNLFAQNERKVIRQGVKAYQDGDFSEAEVQFRKAGDINHESFEANFNTGAALYGQEKFEETVKQYESIVENSSDPETLAHVWHNIGNSMLEAQQYESSIEAYKNSLRLNPSDSDTKYNLAYAKMKLQEQQQQDQQDQEQNKDQQDQEQNKDQQDQEQNKDQQDQEQNKDQQDQEQNKDQQDQEQNKDQQDQEQNKDQQDQEQQQARPQEISKEDAERMLNAIQQQEKDVKEKVDKKKAAAAKVKTEKDW
ncbi:MAG: tetratricopeptide repeat protein [Bacteroidota bacterium]